MYYSADLYADIDFETYSEAGYLYDPIAEKWVGIPGAPQGKKGLLAVGAPRYAEHPSTEVLCLAYRIPGQTPRLWKPTDSPPLDLFEFIRRGGICRAWNSSFEYYIWYYVCHSRMGWPALPLTQLRCDMAKAASWGLPGKLGKAADVINAPEQKDKRGEALIRKLCVPRNPTKKDKRLRYTPADAPEDFAALYEYCLQDIKAEEAVAVRCPELRPEELTLWHLDQRINTRGVYIDPEGLANCSAIVQQARDRYSSELIAITGIPHVTVDKRDQLIAWMSTRGFNTKSIDSDHVEAALARTDIPPEVRRVLEIRQTLGSASVKKTAALERTVSSDNRLRDVFVFHGARQTGRFAGMGVQPHNLPGSGPLDPWGIDEVDRALSIIASRDLKTVEAEYGDATAVVAGCLRGLFSAAPGHELICSDFAAIEAVVLAELAGEPWRQDVFRSHGKIYEMSASKITGIPFTEFMRHKEETGNHHPMRKKIGKVAELASGYQGSVGAWKAFGADEFMTDDEILQNVRAWRKASPRIVDFWYGLQDAATAAIQSPGTCYRYGLISYGVKDDILYCQLPSGRRLTYHKPRLHSDVTPWGKPTLCITFQGWNSDSTKGPVGWMERDTYGGKLCENVVQATARDILAYSMINLEAAGYPIVLHVHDEIVSEVPKDYGSVEDFERIMSVLPDWAAGWPVKASGGWRGRRYRKD